jgi:D-apionolactonase
MLVPSDTDQGVIRLSTRTFTCFFETHTGFLRRIKTGNTEIIRMIYGAVRDHNWDTVEPRISIEGHSQQNDSFHLGYIARCLKPENIFQWTGEIAAQAGTLTFRFSGEARTDFEKNRIGLCVLHPIRECAGKPCRVRSEGGPWIASEFPRFISPHQPFKDLGALSWNPADGIEAEIRFGGDIFETEDQRNWTDASFKTYSTPLTLPFPVKILRGDKIEQDVLLQVRIERPTVHVTHHMPRLAVSEPAAERPVPDIGLGLASHGVPLSSAEAELLEPLRLDHLRVDLHLSDLRWKETLARAVQEASAIKARLQTALFVTDSDEEELRQFKDTADPNRIGACLIFHEREKSTPMERMERAARILNGFRLVTGTNAYFAELNRQRPSGDHAVCYSINPQVHTFDDLSLIETLEAQPATVESALQFCRSGLLISPITLRPRFNPNATGETIEPNGDLPSTVDPRQRTLFTAAWTSGTLAQLLYCDGVESLTFFETTGWRGLMETVRGSPPPEKFPSSPGEIFPVYHVFAALAGAEKLVVPNVPAPQEIASILFRSDSGNELKILLANLSSGPSSIEIELPHKTVTVQRMEGSARKFGSEQALFAPGNRGRRSRPVRLDFAGYGLALLRCT